MKLRSGRRLKSQMPPGARRHFQRRRCPDSGAGLIITLPDDLLLQVLVRLRCARAAALTGLLSRQWRGLWAHLTELSFRDITPEALETALNQVACPALSRLKIEIPMEHAIDPTRVSALLGAAARLAPADLVFDVWGHPGDSDIAVEIPYFNRATSIKLKVFNLYLVPTTATVQFPVVEMLSVVGCCINISELIPRCPRLRVLEGLRMCAYMDAHFIVSFSAPMLNTLCLWCGCVIQNVGIGELWRMRYMQLGIEKKMYVLYLCIDAPVVALDTNGNFSQQIAPLPAFSYLHLQLAKGHAFGAIIFHLLGVCSTIRSLTVCISETTGQKPCLPNCSCDQPQNWRTQNISLRALEEVEMQGFSGTDHDVDFLKLLFRCATSMKRMIVILAPKVFTGSRGSRKMYSLFRANPSVACSVHCGW